MPSMDAKKATVILNVICVVGLSVATVLAGVLLSDAHDTVELALKTGRLASELRQSSDDLTRFVRTYTVTGNYSYWEYFQRVIATRNGELPLPDEPWRNYWDLYISDGKAPRGFGPPHALRDRMRLASFTDDELALLDEAQRQSDALIDLEDVASHAMEGLYRPANTTELTEAEAMAFSVRRPPNQTYAMGLVHGIDYHQWKGRIMRPLDEFAAASARRVEAAIEATYRNNIVLIGVLALMLLMLIAVLGIYYGKIASDVQTQHLLSAVLPERVVESISIGQFNSLREVAEERTQGIRRNSKVGAGGIHGGGGVASTMPLVDFPVLYAEFLPMAWVAFTDVVKFTDMCRYTPSHQVISILNELFSLIDFAAIKFKVEKIKTIGDAFMAAKLSVSEFSDDNDPERVADDGLEIVQFLLRACSLARGVVRPRDPTAAGDVADAAPSFLELRVGLNVGPCASGIVGFERPLYDLFGDTVNTAARLEANGRVGRIHVLEGTLSHFGKRTRDLFFDGAKTEIHLKGLGTATTRFIMGARSTGEDSISDTASVRSAVTSRYAQFVQGAEREAGTASPNRSPVRHVTSGVMMPSTSEEMAALPNSPPEYHLPQAVDATSDV